MSRVVVVGAGIAGLTVAERLAAAGVRTLVVERGAQVGGNCRSFRYGPYTFDAGIHCFDAEPGAVNAFVLSHCQDTMVPILRKKTACYFQGAYRPELGALRVRYLPPPLLLRGVWDFLSRKRKGNPESLGESAASVYGRTFYKLLIQQKTEQLTQVPCEKLHVDFGASFWLAPPVEGLTIPAAFKKVLGQTLGRLRAQRPQTRPQAPAAFYPSAGGFGDFCERLAHAFVEEGGELLRATSVDRLELGEGRIRSIALSGGRLEPVDWVVWTGSLPPLLRLLKLSLELSVPALNLVLYNQEVEGTPRHEYLWTEHADADIRIHRASLNNRYRPLNAPRGFYGVSAEVPCRADEAIWSAPERFIPQVQAQLVRVGFVSGEHRFGACHIERIPRVWPILNVDYRRHLEPVLQELAKRAGNLLLTNQKGLGFQTMNTAIQRALEIAQYVGRSSSADAALNAVH